MLLQALKLQQHGQQMVPINIKQRHLLLPVPLVKVPGVITWFKFLQMAVL